MNDQVFKSKRVSSEELGLRYPGVSDAYIAKKKEQQERWAKEDAEKAKNK